MSKFSDNVSEEDRKRIIQLCRQYLGGVWDKNELTIKRFAEGYFNRIFYCELTNANNNVNNTKHNAVVIKLALEEEFFLYHPLLSTINSLVISEANLSPKILGAFPGGLISEFIQSRSYNELDYTNSAIVTLLAQKLAKFHSIQSPIPRDGTQKWMHSVFDDYLEPDSAVFGEIRQQIDDIIESNEYPALKSVNIRDELIWVRNAILSSDKILVFSHCDFNRGNILVQQNNQTLDLLLIDFDFVSNNFRGIDFGRYFSSWRHKDPNFGCEGYPTDEQMSEFIDAYIEESNRLTGNEFSKNKLNSREHLIKEAKLFTLVGIIIDVLFCLFKAGMEKTAVQEFMEKGERRYVFYIQLKEKFLKENSLPNGVIV